MPYGIVCVRVRVQLTVTDSNPLSSLLSLTATLKELYRCLGARSHRYCCLDPIPTEGGRKYPNFSILLQKWCLNGRARFSRPQNRFYFGGLTEEGLNGRFPLPRSLWGSKLFLSVPLT